MQDLKMQTFKMLELYLHTQPYKVTRKKYIGHFSRFGNTCKIFKNVENTHGGMLLLVK